MMIKGILTILAVAVCTCTLSAEKLVIKGSDTLGAKLVPQLAEEFKQERPTVTFEIAAEGSSTGIAALIDKTADIGMSSRDAKESEVAKARLEGVEMRPITVAFDGIAVIVNENNPISDLSTRDIERIFTGDVTDWSAVRGKPGPISVYTRNTSSGTYSSFKELAMRKRDYGPNTQKMAGNEQIASEVASNLNGVGYVGLAYIDTPGVKVVTIRRKAPTVANIVDGSYPYARPLYFYVDKNHLSTLAEDFIFFTLGPKGQKLVKDVHFVPVGDVE